MFSFHKPKIYRSLLGCCICRAKSSSSRFTDSKRYENDFEQCFGIDEHRSGEICNACVLLVKRWKKLPKGSTRNWHHVVDARAGPGTKSMYKIKNRTKELPDDHSIMKKKHKHKHKHKKRSALSHLSAKPPHSPSGMSDDIAMGDEGFSDNYPSRTPSPGNSDMSDDEDDRSQKSEAPPATASLCGGRRRKQPAPARFSSFLDLTYWKETEICCGIIFKGANGEVMVDPRLMHPCRSCKTLRFPDASATPPPTKVPPAAPSTKLCASSSCASSDSGVGVGTPDDLLLSYRADDMATPPPPTLEPQPHLVPANYPGDYDDDDEEDDEEEYLPPRFSKPFHVDDDDDSLSSEAAAAASAVLDLSMGLSRQRFIPMHV